MPAIVALGLCVTMALLALRSCELARPRKPGAPEPTRASTREELRKILDAGVVALAIPDTSGADSTWVWVKEFYAQRSGGPAGSGRSPHHQAGDLVHALARIEDAGLDPRAYGIEELTKLLDQARDGGIFGSFGREQTLAELDVRATYAALRVAPHLRDGHVPRGLLGPDW